MEAVNLYLEPELKDPSLVAAWPGMGGVAVVAARYLKDRLGAEEFGRIEPYDFFPASMVPIQDHVVGEPEFPESKFYFWDGGRGKSLIIFIGEAQPPSKGYRFANLVLDTAQRFKAKRVYTFAAAPAHIYHTIRPRVLGVATHPDLIDELRRKGAIPMDSGSISGMNGVLLGVARGRNMEGICLLGQIPVYATQIASPKAAKAVLQVLTRMLEIEIDMSELDEWAEQTDEQLEQMVTTFQQSLGEGAERIINYFETIKQSAAEAESEQLPEFSTEELLKEVERFLRRGQKGEN
jgi:hypothetical protein